MPSIPKLNFDIPSLSDIELPKLPACDAVDLPSFEQVTDVLRDAAYVGVGAVVVLAERVQAVAADVTKQVGDLVQTSLDQVRAAATN